MMNCIPSDQNGSKLHFLVKIARKQQKHLWTYSLAFSSATPQSGNVRNRPKQLTKVEKFLSIFLVFYTLASDEKAYEYVQRLFCFLMPYYNFLPLKNISLLIAFAKEKFKLYFYI